MKIGVCAKVTPDTGAQIKVVGNGIDTAGIKWVVNPYDAYAIEEAVKTVGSHGGSVHLFTVGDDSVVAPLRAGGLAVGGEDLTQINDAALSNADALGVAKALAASLKAAGVEAVFAGKESVDGVSSQVPAMVAELLGWPLVSVITGFETDGSTFKATREIGGGVVEVVTGTLPAVFTADKGLNTPRYAKLPQIMKAKRKKIIKQDLAALGLSADDVAPKASESGFSEPAARPAGRVLSGSVQEQAKELVQLLRNEAKVI